MRAHSLALRLTGLAVIALPLLLLDIGPGHADSRLYHTAWNLGHPLLLGLLAWLLAPLGVLRALGLSLLTAATIEGLQGLTGRTPSAWDILYSMGGAMLAVGFRADSCRRRLGLFLVGMLALLPLARNLVDEVWMRLQFPVLVGEPDVLSVTRWRSVPRIGERDGRRAWAVTLQSRYDGLWLRHLVGDWSEYDALQIHLDVSGPVSLTVRMDDRQHWLSGQRWADRYNVTWTLPAGTQTLRIPLAAVRRAPASRELNLSEVQSLYLFVPVVPSTPVTLRIFSIELVRE